MTGPKKGSLAQSILLMITVITVFALQAVNSVTKNELEDQARQPAAIPGLGTIEKATEQHSFSVKLNCQEYSEFEQNSRYPFVRIVSSPCDSKHKAKEIRLTNVTNGMKATVFELAQGFTTDLIRLKPGKNKILIVEKFDQGKEVRRTLTVTSNASSAHQE